MIIFGDAAPVGIDHRGPVRAWSDAIFPMVFVGETAAWPAQQGQLDSLQRLDNVVANAARVGDRALLSDPDSFVNAVAKVFGKLAIDVSADGVFSAVGVDNQLA